MSSLVIGKQVEQGNAVTIREDHPIFWELASGKECWRHHWLLHDTTSAREPAASTRTPPFSLAEFIEEDAGVLND